MADPTTSPPSSSPSKTPTERIQELNAINEQIPQLLTTVSTAIRALTASPLPSSSSPNTSATQPSSLTAHKATFQQNTHTFFTGLLRISDALKDQAEALEAAGIIPPTYTKAASREMSAADLAAFMGGATPGMGVGTAQSKDSEATVRNGGLGDLDVGWLNARASDVGAGMEGEVLGRVREILEAMAVKGKGEERDGDMVDV